MIGALTAMKAFGAAKAVVARVPAMVWAGIMVGMLALLIVQTIRIEGFQIRLPFIGAVGPSGLKADNLALRTRIDALEAQKALASRVKAQTEAANTRATEKADTDVKRNLEQERVGADAFIARGGVRPCPGPARTAESDGPGIDAGGSAMSVVDVVQPDVVTVLPDDVHICTENTVKAKAWQEWGLSIEANHAGE
jgi:hypothetical protein